MTNHKIIAQPWQLKAAAEGTLRAIILPFPEGCVSGSPENWPVKSLKCGFNESYCIYLAEEWVKSPWGNDNGKITGYIYFTKSRVPEAKHMGWQPAETMPEEAAQYWFEVGDVRVVQMSDIDRPLCDRAALTDIPLDLPCGVEEWASILMRWNAAHPDYPWDADRWVIVLDLKELKNENA
jgi:hypothetical protein